VEWNEKLRFARKVLGLSLRDVEKQTGISNSYLCQLESGKILDPSFIKMMVLIKFYNIDVSDLI
jgi:transcriptional regulator with XRE-family HTH domain